MLKQTNTKFKRRLTVAGLAAVAISAIIPFASSSAWGPERTTFTMKNPSDYVTFNSITDNTALGDERNFVRVMEVGSGNKYSDSVTVTPGKEYEVYIYFHNNAKSSLNTAEGAPGIARQVRISTGLSSWTVNSSKKVKISGLIASSNAKPTEVWDEAFLTANSTKDILLKYVPASAVIHNAYKANGSVLSDKYLFSNDGVYIGENELNGYIPGCAEYSGYITYRLKAYQAGSKISKTVSKDGKNFFETVDAKPGDTLTYKVEFQNTGNIDLTDVTFSDKLPNGVTLVPGTTRLVNAANPNGLTMKDIIGQNGFNTGLYTGGATAVITYQVKVNDDAVADKKCNSKTSFKNKITVSYKDSSTNNTSSLTDSSTIKVTRECEDKPDCKEGDPECTPQEECKEGNPECDTVEEECNENDVECICEKNPKDPICQTPEEPSLPKTGPGEIALAIVAVVCIATGGIYWYRSQKDLAAVEKGLTKDGGNSDK